MCTEEKHTMCAVILFDLFVITGIRCQLVWYLAGVCTRDN